MLSWVKIKNFRSHEESFLEFCSGINCIIGLPGSGKTNIIRAIDWACSNRPLGFKFHSNFSSEPTAVELGFPDGQKFKFEKVKSSGRYYVNDSEQPLSALKAGVPDEITLISQMRELNTQRQLDQPFLICSTPTQVSKTFNRITKIEQPDAAVSELTTDINSANKELKIMKTEKNRLQENYDALAYVEEMAKSFDEIRAAADELEKEEENLNKLSPLLADILKAKEQLESYSYLDSALSQLLSISVDSVEVANSQQLISEIENLAAEISGLSEKLAVLDKDTGRATQDIENLEALYRDFSATQDESEKLSVIITDIERCLQIFGESKANMDNKVAEYRSFLSTITVCPFCEHCKTPIASHNLETILEKLK